MVKNILLILLTVFMLLFAGCSGMDIDSAIKAIPQVKSYLENNPDFDLQVVYYSETEVTSLADEFRANCGKDLVNKALYRFLIDDKKSVSGVGYFDLDNSILECFKKREGTQMAVEGESTDSSLDVEGTIVVDNVLVSADGSVKVGNNVNVDADGSVIVGGISISSDNVVKINEDIVVEGGNVKVGDIVISGESGVSVGDIQVGTDGSVVVGDIIVDADGTVMTDDVYVDVDGTVMTDDVYVDVDGTVMTDDVSVEFN